METNKEFYSKLSSGRAQFFLADFHVHSPASKDVVEGERFDALSVAEKGHLEQVRSVEGTLSDYEAALIDRDAFPVAEYVTALTERRNQVAQELQLSEGEDWALIAVTDHNVCRYACKVAAHAWQTRTQNRLIVLPGIELNVTFPVPDTNETTAAHILLVFSPDIEDRHVCAAIREASGTAWDFGSNLSLNDLPTFIQGIRHHSSYDAIAIAAHIGTSQGLRERTVEAIRGFWRSEAEFARMHAELAHVRSGEDADAQTSWEEQELRQKLDQVEREIPSEDAMAVEALRLIGACGFDALQVRDGTSGRHYRRLHRFAKMMGRATPIVCSDAHTTQHVFRCQGDEVPFVKMFPLCTSRSPRDVFLEVREKSLRYGETRFAVDRVNPAATWISGIEIAPDAQDAAEFWPFADDRRTFVLPLSRNLNCLIGGRGSGKSAAIEALSFATEPTFLDKRANNLFLEDCLKRAKATLSGCNVRVCWTVLDAQGEFFEKRAVFASRYFDSSGGHGDITFSDLNDVEIPSPSLPVTLFRLHEVEELVDEPKELLKLFDSLCGGALAKTQSQISSLIEKLVTQRRAIVDIAKQLCVLTRDDSPLRTYVFRKEQYDRVNTDEVRGKYDRLDQATGMEQVSTSLQGEWGEILENLKIDEYTEEAETLFSELAENTLDSEGNPCEFSAPLRTLLQSQEGQEKSSRDRVVDSMKATQSELASASGAIQSAVGGVAEQAKEERDRMARDGLPVGGRERESKKAGFDESAAALANYRTLMLEWQEALRERQRIFEKLVTECKARTDIRKSIAQEISKTLQKEFDPSVLVIAVDAQPIADKTAFEKWINEHLYPSGTQAKKARTKALVEDGLEPAELRTILLGEGDLPSVDRDSVSKGNIDGGTAEQFKEHCWGKRRLAPEKQEEEITPEEWQDLPKEIRDGLWEFPYVEGSDGEIDVGRIDAVLELDEILFDDVPEIRMMDRPGEMTGGPRPLAELSPGQRCSAILPILLLNGTCPLIIDQPEDNLDNRLIREVVVKILASIKLKRQVILATHNPNLPVLGDVEQAVILRAIQDKKGELEATGNLDSDKVVRLITDIMEGGREAFQYRHAIYQGYWEGPVAEEE